VIPETEDQWLTHEEQRMLLKKAVEFLRDQAINMKGMTPMIKVGMLRDRVKEENEALKEVSEDEVDLWMVDQIMKNQPLFPNKKVEVADA